MGAPPASPQAPTRAATSIGRRFKDPADPLRRWAIPVLFGVFLLLLGVWMILVHVRSPEIPGEATGGTPVATSPGAQQPSRKGLQGPPPPPKAGAAGVAEPAGVTWIDASREPWISGDVAVKVANAAIAKAKLIDSAKQVSDTQDEYLVLSIEVANRSSTRKVQFRGWSPRDDQMRLTDDLKNSYTLQTAPGGASFEGQQRNKSVYPEKTIEDLLVFERPVERARTLRLQLPASAFEGTGMGYLEISMSMVKSANGPNFRPPPESPAAKPKPASPKEEAKKADASKVSPPAKPSSVPKTSAGSHPPRMNSPERDFGIKADEPPLPSSEPPAKPGPAPPPAAKGPPPTPNGKAS